MFIHELFSKLKARQQKAGQPVIYKYDEIPVRFRHQVVHIWKDAIGAYDVYSTSRRAVWNTIHDLTSRELGIPALGDRTLPPDNCVQFLYKQDADHVLDIIQVSFNVIEHYFTQYNGDPGWMKRQIGLSYPPDMAIEELNLRFLENDLGYQYQNGQIIRIDSQFTYSEAIHPALQLLNNKEFKPALSEFLEAHEHYKKGRYESAINEALKAFESTMKIIIISKGWSVDQNATAGKLIQICFDKQLLPTPLASHFTGLRTTLESGLPTIRNKYSGHGDGVNTINVPAYLVQYALNLTATNIVFLIQAYKA